MAEAAKVFDPNAHQSGLLEAFIEFIGTFEYTYDSLGREPPASANTAELRTAWSKKDKRKQFLGRYSNRDLQKRYEDITTEAEREAMTYDDMVAKFKAEFEKNANKTLANYKFRQLSQSKGESFDTFALRVKREAKGCKFACTSETCTVKDTMIRDQLIIGTSDISLRQRALAEEWNLQDMISKGKSIEAATKGAAIIKVKEEPRDVRKTKGGKFSKKARRRNQSSMQQTDTACKNCSLPRCRGGKSCPAAGKTCFACQKQGHFRDAQACKVTTKEEDRKKSKKKKGGTRKKKVYVLQESSDSDSESRYSSRSSSEQSDEGNTEDEGSQTNRIYAAIPQIRRVGNMRVPRIRRTSSKYRVKVLIKEQVVPVFIDTGADICVMSQENARKLRLQLGSTDMRIRPYGSRQKKCVGQFTGTVTKGDKVANTTIYIVKDKVETLLSGPVSEALGIIRFEGAQVNRAEEEEAENEAKKAWIRKYPRIFKGLGKLKDYVVKLHVDKKVKPVREPPRPVSFHLAGKRDEALAQMEKDGVIEEHKGPTKWISNLVLAPKDDGGTRVVLDMRNPNQAIKSTHLPIPRPEHVSSQLAGYKVFSKLDFKSAFHQLELDENSRQLTVFHAGTRLMRFKRLIMGCSPASGELNKALRPLFQEAENTFVIQDDLIVAGKTKKEHDMALDKVCKIIEDSGMTLNPDKCLIEKQQIPWWGMQISESGLSPDPQKVQAIKEMTPPQNKEEVASFFCMIQSDGYGRDFIPDLAKKTKNIRKLLKKHARFEWTAACQSEFEALRREYRKDILMRHYDPNLKTWVVVDASKDGLSAMLVQGTEEEKHTVAVASRTTSEVEGRYPQLDLEALAVDYGLRRFRFYLVGAPEVRVVTDHKPLIAIFKNIRRGSSRTERIKLRHQDINYKVEWQKGKTNKADYLSRHATPWEKVPPEEKEETNEFEKTVWFTRFSPYTEAVSIQEMVKQTQLDPELSALKKALKKGYMQVQNAQY